MGQHLPSASINGTAATSSISSVVDAVWMLWESDENNIQLFFSTITRNFNIIVLGMLVNKKGKIERSAL